MCGIAGTLDGDEGRARERVAALNGRQAHRGPDHAVVVRAGSFTLGNTRLAIQDPTPAGNQPFRSSDGRFVCVFNGEVYNHRELATSFGLRLPSGCDGAVIPELWSRLGPACLRHLRGMYAVAVVDTQADTLTLARDPFGIKPLYHRRDADGSLVFASEARALAAAASTGRPPVSRDAVAAFLHRGAVPATAAPFAGMAALAPNRALTVDAGGGVEEHAVVDGERPWEGAGDDPGRDFADSVELHLRSDVPTTLLLSGGFDSAALAAAGARLGRRLTCLTVDGVGPADEAPAAARTAVRYGHQHRVVPAALGEDDVEAFFAAMQRPSIDGLNTFLVCRAVAAGGFRVALSGLGGDEALGGYAHYRGLRWLAPLRLSDRLPGASRLAGAGQAVARRTGRSAEKVTRLLAPGGPRRPWDLGALQREVLPAAAVRRLTGVDPAGLFGHPPAGASGFEELVAAELAHYLQPMLLADADAFSMCSSVELRVPFLDRPFFASAVRSAARSGPGRGKQALARALGDPFLDEVGRRPKRGFSVPMGPWLATGPLAPLRAALDAPDAPVWGLVDRSARPTGGAEAGAGGRWSSPWALVVLDRWLRSLADD